VWLVLGLVGGVLTATAWLISHGDSGVEAAATGAGDSERGQPVTSAPLDGDPAGGDSGRHVDGPAQLATAAPSQVDAQRPRAVMLPSGTTMPVDAAATGIDGELVIPSDIDRVGWWDGSSRLGDPFGSIVLAAHIDSFAQGLGRFVELLEMQPGDRVTVSTQGLTQEFRVVSAELVPKSTLSRTSSVYSIVGKTRLVLITCGGEYDANSGGYQDNMVVEAVPIGAVRPR
jgi:hypothetical protein